MAQGGDVTEWLCTGFGHHKGSVRPGGGDEGLGGGGGGARRGGRGGGRARGGRAPVGPAAPAVVDLSALGDDTLVGAEAVGGEAGVGVDGVAAALPLAPAAAEGRAGGDGLGAAAVVHAAHGRVTQLKGVIWVSKGIWRHLLMFISVSRTC